MRKFTLASLLLTTILLTNFSFAQTCDSTCTKDQIQFHLVNDYSVSYLKMLTPTSGLRYKIDLGLSGSTGDEDVANKYIYGTNQTSFQDGNDENNSSSQYVNLVFNYMMFHKLADEVSFYWGAGPLLSYSRSHSESISDRKNINQNQTYFSNSKSERTSSFIGAGLQLALGMEVSITQKLSFLAEFNLNGTYSWNKYSYSSTSSESQSSSNRNEHTENGNSWSYGLNQLKLGIAYRF
ncbi:MAG: hypothetical protein HYZ10_07520 [Ignavibacteriales bacterium]|nr:hypothetical protein [Ignavibacteriales bacterium]